MRRGHGSKKRIEASCCISLSCFVLLVLCMVVHSVSVQAYVV